MKEEIPAVPSPKLRRCKRNDGRSWRCKLQQVDGGGGFCQAHYLQRLGRVRDSAKGNGGEEKEESLKAGEKYLTREDSEEVSKRSARVKEDVSRAGKGLAKGLNNSKKRTTHEEMSESARNLQSQKDISPSKRVVDEFEGEDETILAKDDGEDEKEKIMESRKNLKRKDVEKVYKRPKRAKKKGIENGPSHIEKHEESPSPKERQRSSRYDSLQNLREVGDIAEEGTNVASIRNNNPDAGDNENQGEDTLVAPKPSPSSSNIGAPSASESGMVVKDGSQKKVPDVIVLENRDTETGKKIQRDRKASRSGGEFSISRCAAVLNEMTGFTPEELVEASKVFVKPFNREMFLSLKDELRRVWLRAQISG